MKIVAGNMHLMMCQICRFEALAVLGGWDITLKGILHGFRRKWFE